MKKLLLSATLLSLGFTALPATAEVSIGADLVSRYVWRGTDWGDAASIQPGISYSTGSLEIGAWSSWAIAPVSTPTAGNENDLYVSFSAGPIGITVSDYYFPAYTEETGKFPKETETFTTTIVNGDTTKTKTTEKVYTTDGGFFNYGKDGGHTIEVMLSYEVGSLSLAGAINILNDDDNSLWLEANYGFGEIGETEVSASVGLGNGVYTVDSDPMLVSVGVNASKGDYFASYIINPDRELNFLVFGRSF